MFGSALLQPARSVCVSLGAFFIVIYFPSEYSFANSTGRRLYPSTVADIQFKCCRYLLLSADRSAEIVISGKSRLEECISDVHSQR